ncbi:MAG: hypothetical protein WCT14_09120 [Treponemataceae bacterium]
MKRLFFAVLALAVSLPILGAEEPAKTPLRVLTRVVAESGFTVVSNGSVVSNGYERLASSLDAALVRLPRVVALRRLSASENALEAAAAAAYDLIVELRVSAVEGTTRIRIARRIQDGSTGGVLEESTEDVPSPTENELSQTFWLSLSAAVEKISPAPRTALLPIAASDPAVTVPAALRPWIVEAGLYMAQFPDLWAGKSFFDERLFVKLGLYQFFGGTYFGSSYSDSNTTFRFVSLPLVQPGLVFGAYFAGPASVFRPYLSLTAFIRVLTDPLSLDPLAPYGSTLLLGLERRIVPGISAFLELGAAFYPFCDGYLLAASKGVSTDGGYGFSYGPTWFLEYPQFRFGVRVFL